MFIKYITGDLKINDEPIKAIFDTGAHIDYVHRSITKDLQIIGKTKDFHPYYHKIIFDVNLFNVNTKIGNMETNYVVGNVYKELEASLKQGGVKGIFGTSIFKGRSIVYSYRRKKIYFSNLLKENK